MTTYPIASLSDAVIAYQKPITLQQGRGFRDMVLSVAEADATAPLSLMPTVLLGTLATTSGTTATLSSLVLTPYKFLRITLNGVSFTIATSLQLDGISIVNAALGAAGNALYGTIVLDLGNGVAVNSYYETTSSNNGVKAVSTSYSTATTSIVFSGGTFDAGSIRVYGEK